MTEFSVPRLVEVYETLNAYEPGTQPDFYADLAAELGAVSIVDVGCGTGLITRSLARRGHRMTGLDPAPAMLAVARMRPWGDRVRRIEGPVKSLPALAADLAMMSGHVAQFFLDDASWQAALTAIAGALRTGGHLAFETRDPAARAWETWGTRRTAVDPVYGRIAHWTTMVSVRDAVVAYELHYLFEDGEHVVVPGALRWRTLASLTTSLARAGFTIEQTYGDWDRRPAGRELIIVASLSAAR
jgi:SAM-dependent methyltransferase